MNASASLRRSPLRYFLLVFALSIPFWLIGAMAGRGLPLPMNLPQVVSRDEWQAAREEMLVKEKEATMAQDALAAERRRLPMVRIDKEYLIKGLDGEASLVDLFEG